MRTAFAIGLIAAVSVSAASAEPCRLVRVASLDSNVDGSDHLYVPAQLGGRQTNLMVDTGGVWSLIKADLADELKLERHISHATNLGDAAGNRLKEYVRVNDFKLGALAFNGPVDFIVMPGYSGDLDRFGGTIGLNILARADVELDNAAKKVNLFRPSRCQGAGAYWANEYAELPLVAVDGLPETKIDVEGESVRALIDTGTTRTFMSLSLARRKFGLTPTSPGVTPGRDVTLPSGKVLKSYDYTFTSLTVSAFRFEDVRVVLSDTDHGLILGMSQLKQLHLYFAWDEKKLYATTADARR